MAAQRPWTWAYVAIAALLIALVQEASAAQGWRASVSRDPPGVSLEATARDGRTRLYGGCNNLLRPGFVGTLNGYPGRALRRVDNATERVTFEIEGAGGLDRYQSRFAYFAHERVWSFTDALPPAFYERLATGRTLTLRNTAGAAIALFDLDGAARAVDVVKGVCRPWQGN